MTCRLCTDRSCGLCKSLRVGWTWWREDFVRLATGLAIALFYAIWVAATVWQDHWYTHWLMSW